MISRTTKRFRACLLDLPPEVRQRAREAYTLFCRNPGHPSLQFKKVHAIEPIYSVRISRNYRAVGLLGGNEVVWFWIGKHGEYEKLLASL
jgi:hypothetical protein